MKSTDRMRTIVAVEASPPATLKLKWSDGTRARADIAKLVRGRAYRAVRGAEFARVRVDEWGHGVVWPSGAELSAETLWLATLSATGRDDARAFLEWRLRHGLSLTATAQALGLSRRMVAYYSNGDKPVPRTIALACKGWELDRAA
jgi:hypothetical protein